MNKPHKHAELIKAWADGAEIEGRDQNSPYRADWQWEAFITPSWHDNWEYRIKPERVFPETSMDASCLCKAALPNIEPTVALLYKYEDMLRRVANAAIKQYILDMEKQS